jgi:peptidoglycan/LPS O-acetylase OafA/YrhL
VGGYLITPRVYDSLGQSIVNVGLVLFVWHCVTTRGGWLVHALNWRPIMFLGVLSYSLYLWQQLFLNANSRSFLASFPVNIGMSVAAALVSYYVVERPFLEARKFFPHARSRPRSAAAGDRVPVTAASADRVDGTAVKIN